MTPPQLSELQSMLAKIAVSPDEYVEAVRLFWLFGSESLNVKIPRRCGHDDLIALSLSASRQVIGRELSEGRECEFCFESRLTYQTRQAVALGLPGLEGTDRQVAYAFDIRNRAIERHGLDAVRAAVWNRRQAKWWIDNILRLAHLKIFREVEAGDEAG